jgi:AcrR family transcriptional regulator
MERGTAREQDEGAAAPGGTDDANGRNGTHVNGNGGANGGGAAARRAAAQRLQMRQELAAAAMELFSTQGYEETTVDQIAAAAGVARRTFFRYFRSKEEAIFPDHDETLVRVADLLAASDPAEHPIDVVCRGIKEVLRMYASAPAVSVARYRLIRQVPTLREREITVVARYERLFTRYLLGRFDGAERADDPMLAEVSAAAVVAAHNHVLRRWLRAGGRGDAEAQLDHAFEVIRRRFWSDVPRPGGQPADRSPNARSQNVTPGASPEVAPSATGRSPMALEAAVESAVSASAAGEVLITVARTDAPLDEVLESIRAALGRSAE